MKYRNALSLMAISILLLLPYLLFLALFPYQVSSGDETYQIQAALQLLRGEGYNATVYSMPLDLSVGKFNYLFRWPIGYSAVLFLILKTGLKPLAAAALMQAATVVGGFFAWSLCSSLFLEKTWMRVAFLALMAIHFFSWGNYNTAAFSWGLMGILTWWIVRWCLESKPESQILFTLFCGLLSSVLILFRFQNITFVPALFGFLFFHQYKKTSNLKLIRDIFLICILPTFTFYLLMKTNKLYSGQSFQTHNIAPGIYFDLYWVVPKWVSGLLIGGTFRLDQVIPIVTSKLGWNLWWTETLVDIFCLVVFAWVLKFMHAQRKVRVAYFGFQWFLWSYAGFILMLAYTGIRLKMNYTIDQTRYFHYLVPGFILAIWSAIASTKKIRFEILITVVLVLLGIGTSAAFSAYRRSLNVQIERKTDAVLPRLEELQRQYPNHTLFLAADSLAPVLVLRDYKNIYLQSQPLMQEKNFFSAPTLIVLIHDKTPLKEIYADLEKLDFVSKRFHLNHEIRDAGMEIYWGVMPAEAAPPLPN